MLPFKKKFGDSIALAGNSGASDSVLKRLARKSRKSG